MRCIKLPLLIVATCAFLTGAASTASAYDLTLTAQGVCEAGTLRISYRVDSWTDTNEGAHNNVDVLFNQVVVDNFDLPPLPNFYANVRNAPAGAGPGDTVVVTAWAHNGHWDGDNGSQVEATDSVTVTLPDPCGGTVAGVGRFTGGGHAIDASNVKITRGFTIHCDLILSNNLEVNWPGTGRQNQFHMTQHTSASCLDDPRFEQRPPRAPVDTIVGVGTGRFNGVAGATIYFTLVDAGEPGTSDWIALRVVDAGGNEVLNLPLQNITGGNIQAHYDQPHGQRP